jgi:HTH-type transcriptional regulator, transcriptional repressor of NAD biosynthesis genes
MINGIKLICLYGPESTGKSVMAEHLAKIYQTEYVPEVAREIVTSNQFTVEDIIKIGQAQTDRIMVKTKTANKFLFCDTDIITTQIYSRHYLGFVPPILYELEKEINYDAYFLFDVDVPWVADGMRDLGNQRKEMFEVFKSELAKRAIAYHLVGGDWGEREARIKKHLLNDEYPIP